MRRFFLVLTLLLAPVLGISQLPSTTYVGTIRDLTGAIVTSGRITFTLNAPSGGSIPGIGSFVATTVSCLINATGNPVSSLDGVSACVITDNSALTPTGTSYTMCRQPQNITPGSCFITFANGGTADISTIIPTPSTMPNYGFPAAGPQGVQGPQGIQGIQGIPALLGLGFGAYASGTTYGVGSVVTFGMNSYASLISGNIGNEPDISPSQWGLLANLSNLPIAFASQSAASPSTGNFTTVTSNTSNSVYDNKVVNCPLGDTVLQCVTLLPAGGGTVRLLPGIYRSGYEGTTYLTLPNIVIEGSGMPWFNSATAPTALAGGTVIQGSFLIATGANFITLRNLGVDVGSTFVNAAYGGTPADALSIFNPGQIIGATPVQSPIIENIVALCFNAAANVHGILVENVDHASIRNTASVYGVHGAVLKGTHSVWDGDYERGHSVDSFILKSDPYAVSSDDQISHINIQPLVTQGDTQGLILGAIDAGIAHVTLSGVICGPMTGNCVQLDGGSSTISAVTISNVIADYATETQSAGACIALQNAVVRVTITNLACANYFQGIGSSSLTGTDIIISNSTFTDITNNAITIPTTSAFYEITGSTFTNIGGNAIFNNSTAGAVVINGDTFRSIGAATLFTNTSFWPFVTGETGAYAAWAAGTGAVQTLANYSYNTSSGTGEVMTAYNSQNENGAKFGAYKTSATGASSAMGLKGYCEPSLSVSTLCFQVDPSGIVTLPGSLNTPRTSGTIPTSSAGTVIGHSTNSGGAISGLSAATSVTVTFAGSVWTNAVFCMANPSVSLSGTPWVSAVSLSSVTFNFPSLTGILYYHCDGF